MKMTIKCNKKLKNQFDKGLKEILRNHGEGSAVHQSYLHNFLVRKVYGEKTLRTLIIEFKKRLQYVINDGQYERMSEYHYLDAIISDFFELSIIQPVARTQNKEDLYEQFSQFTGIHFPAELRV